MPNRHRSDDKATKKETSNAELVPKTEEFRLGRADQLDNGSVKRYTRVDPKTNARQMYQHDPETNSQMYLYSYNSNEDPSFKDKFNEKDGKGCFVQRRAAFYTSSFPSNQYRQPNHEPRVQELSHDDANRHDGSKSSAKSISRQPIVEEPDEDKVPCRKVSNRNHDSLALPMDRNDPFASMQRHMEEHMAHMKSAFQDFGMLGRGRSPFDDAFFHGSTMNDDWPFGGGFFGNRNPSNYRRQSDL